MSNRRALTRSDRSGSGSPVHSRPAMNAHIPLVAALAMGALSCSHAATPPEAPSTSAPHANAVAQPVAQPSVLEPGAVRNTSVVAPRSPASSNTTHSGAIAPTPIAHSATPADEVRVRVSRVTATEGEDGRGNTVRATSPVAIDLERTHGWQAGALTTTLHVGALSFYSMGYPEATTMRFVVADESVLTAGGEVALQYGPDPARRRVIAPSLPVIP